MGQQNLSVRELVGRIERGEIRLPEMQRQYVWQASRVRDLIDSLYREYPSGTILTWETDERVTFREFAIDQQTTESKNFQLLLDGQQRLTSLSALLRGDPVIVSNRKRPIDILFNLNHPDTLEEITEVFDDQTENEELDDSIEMNFDDEETADATEDEILQRYNRMAFVVYNNKLANKPNWISVTKIFTSESDTDFLKKAGIRSMDDDLYDKYIKRLQKLRRILKYEYHVHTVDRDKSYEEVTEIFVRVNSRGVKLRSSDLALAQITAKWQDSLAIFQEFEKHCSEIGFAFDTAIHLKNLVAFATNQSKFKSVGSIPLETLKNAWNESKQGMEYALNLLKSNMQIESLALLSSPFLIIILAKYGHLKGYNLTSDEESILRYWALLANAKGRYSRGSSESLLDQDLATLRDDKGIEGLIQSLKTQVGRLEIIPDDLINKKSTSAYFKTMFILFKMLGAKDWHDQLVISLNHSGAKHSLQFHHIFPKSVLERSGKSTQQINDICNLAFIGGRTNRIISNKEPAEYLPNFLKKIGIDELANQCIPDDPKLWRVEAYEEFLDMRRAMVSQRLNEFLQLQK